MTHRSMLLAAGVLLATIGVAAPAQAAPPRPGGVLLISTFSRTDAHDARTGRALGEVGKGADASTSFLRAAYARDIDPCHPDIEGCFGAKDLLIGDLFGAGERVLVHNPEAGGGPSDPDFSPDGSKIVFNWNTPGERSLALISPRGGEWESLASYTGPGTFSPDGRSIAFVKDADVQVIDVATREIRRVTTEGVAEMTGVDWSPDGRRIVYAGDRTIYTVPAAGGESTAADFGPAAFQYPRNPVFSPDGRWVAFGATRTYPYPDETYETKVYASATDGANLTEIADGYADPTEWLGTRLG